jgi:hypothetical protein
MANSSAKKANKYATLVTYLIALACLIVGLFVPLFDGNGILALQLPAAFNCLIGKTDTAFTLSYTISVASLKIDIMAIIVIAYTVVTALGLLALIPIIFSKKTKGTAYGFAGFIEVLAALILSLYAIVAMYLYSQHIANPDAVSAFSGTTLSYNMLIALGGTLLMLIVQGFICKRGGFAKLFYFIFSTVAVLSLFNLVYFVSALETPLTKLSNTIKISNLFYGTDGVYGFRYLATAVSSFATTLSAQSDFNGKMLYIFSCLLALVVLVNFVLDVIGLATKPNSFSHVFNCVRFGIEIALLICLIITLLVAKVAIGLFLILIALMAVIEFVMSIIRCCMYAKARHHQLETEVDEKLYTNVPDSAPAYNPVQTYQPAGAPTTQYTYTTVNQAEPYEEPKKKRKEKPVQQPVQEVPTYTQPEETYENVYTPTYKGPVDSFIKKLNNNERIEFARLFVDRTSGEIPDIPEYIIGGNNKEFFSAVFIYLGRVRSLVSDGLLNKMYNEL